MLKTTDSARPNYLAHVGQSAKVNGTPVRWRGRGRSCVRPSRDHASFVIDPCYSFTVFPWDVESGVCVCVCGVVLLPNLRIIRVNDLD